MGKYRLRAYRVSKGWKYPLSTKFKDIGSHFGKEPCVIYYAEKPPGTLSASVSGDDGTGGDLVVNMKKRVPVRIHDQCFTSEVFRSQR